MHAHLNVTTILRLLARGRGLPVLAVLAVPACDQGVGLDDGGESMRSGQALDPAASIASISMGESTTCAVNLLGETKCWGRNDLGQLGRGDLLDIGDDETPDGSAFIALGGAAIQTVTNGEQTFALLQDGTVRGWGLNSGFALGLQHTESIGDDETPEAAAAVTDVQLGMVATELAVGEDFACALLGNSTVRCWGANDFGQLGRGHTAYIGDDETASQGGALFLGAPVIGVTAGRHHACALVDSGNVYCWGRGAEGQLGHANTEDIGDDEWPVSAGAVGLGEAAVQVVAGGRHTCARLVGGQVRCWGDGLSGQLGSGYSERLGDDETLDARPPVLLGGSATWLAAGDEHTCAILDTGDMRCWGANELGQLGYGHTEAIGDDEGPTAVEPIELGGSVATAVFSGPLSRSTCTVLDDQSLRCWGANDFGQLGYGHVFEVGDDVAERPGDLPDILILRHDDEI